MEESLQWLAGAGGVQCYGHRFPEKWKMNAKRDLKRPFWEPFMAWFAAICFLINAAANLLSSGEDRFYDRRQREPVRLRRSGELGGFKYFVKDAKVHSLTGHGRFRGDGTGRDGTVPTAMELWKGSLSAFWKTCLMQAKLLIYCKHGSKDPTIN